jgi:hypothetical protein
VAGLVPAIQVLFDETKQALDARHIGEWKRRRPSDGYGRHDEMINIQEFSL